MMPSDSRDIDRRDPRSRIGDARQDIDALTTASQTMIKRLLIDRREQITSSATRAALLDPRDILRRGYAIVTTPNGTADRRVTTSRDAATMSTLTITFSDGRVQTRVTGEQE